MDLLPMKDWLTFCKEERFVLHEDRGNSTPSPRTYRRTYTIIRTVQKLLGHKEFRTIMIHTHVLNRGPAGVRSPVDRP
jgi:integrase